MEYQHENPVHAHIMTNPMRFHWHIADQVAGSARPGRYGDLPRDLARVRDERITVIVNLCSEPLTFPDEFTGCFQQIHEQVPDGEAPTPDQLEAIIARVRHCIHNQQRVLIHCRGGIGRTATILIPILVSLTGVSLDQAVTELKKSGRHVQSMHQWNFLLDWDRRRQNNAASPV